MAIPESLQRLVQDGVIDEIQRRLMSGKEASVYVVTRGGVTVAAKVYKARDRRTFKATSSYTEGRNQTRNTRDKRAMHRGSSYGRELMEDSWRDMEYRALTDAHYAGVRVPKPIMIYEDVLLMELLVDADGAPAPRLADFDLTAEEATAMFMEIYRQVRLLMTTGRIHGDLSAFNILVAAAGPTIIDLPQVVDGAGNSQAREILRRDLRNVVEHLARFDERLLRFIDCGDALFHHFQRGTLDEAIEPREVRRVYGGAGRRVQGEERPEGQMGQPRRRGPNRGHGGRGAPQEAHSPRPNGQRSQAPQGNRQDQGSNPRKENDPRQAARPSNGPHPGRGEPQSLDARHRNDGRGNKGPRNPSTPRPSDDAARNGPRQANGNNGGPRNPSTPRPSDDARNGPRQANGNKGGPRNPGTPRPSDDAARNGPRQANGSAGSPPGGPKRRQGQDARVDSGPARPDDKHRDGRGRNERPAGPRPDPRDRNRRDERGPEWPDTRVNPQRREARGETPVVERGPLVVERRRPR